jgi:hypothetical protein
VWYLQRAPEQQEAGQDETFLEVLLSSDDSAAIYSVLLCIFPWSQRNVPLHVPERDGVNLNGQLPNFHVVMSVAIVTA